MVKPDVKLPLFTTFKLTPSSEIFILLMLLPPLHSASEHQRGETQLHLVIPR